MAQNLLCLSLTAKATESTVSTNLTYGAEERRGERDLLALI